MLKGSTKGFQTTLYTLILQAATTYAFTSEDAIQYLRPVDGPKITSPYSPGVLVDLSQGKLLFVSGQLPIDPQTGQKVSSNIKDATRQTLENMERVLKLSGIDFEQVLRIDVFLKDMSDFAGMNEEYGRHFQNGRYPARQTTQSEIPALVEISCIAFVPFEE